MTPLAGPVLSAAAMRAAEADTARAGTSLAELMERAGAAVAEAVWRFGAGHPALVLCGPGNNGGDGYVAARLLKARGLDVRVTASGEPATDLARNARALWDGPVELLTDAQPAHTLVDALFGTGLARPISAELRRMVAPLRTGARLTIAVDLPSGVGTDDGAGMGAFPADITLALGSLKPAHLLHPAAALCGRTLVADIGIAAQSRANVLSPPRMAPPLPADHKYARGLVAIAGGAMGGAAMLSARAAMRLAGYAIICGARRSGPDGLVHRRWDDMASDARVGALLAGPGLGRDEKARQMLAKALETAHPLVLDADALVLTKPDQLADLGRPLILTPHEGEFGFLFGALPGSKIDRAVAAAARAQAVVVLKGADTVIAAPDGEVRIATGAPAWLATAGTGDVLAGMAAARLAATGDPFRAACEAVWLHGEAARIAGPCLTADDLPAHIPAAVAACLP